MPNVASPSPVRTASGLTWTKVELKIRRLARAGAEDLPIDVVRTLYHLELQAAQHAAVTPRSLLERAKRLVRDV